MIDIEIKSRPFTRAQLKRINQDLALGKIRRFGAVVSHYKLGFTHNALIAWKKKDAGARLSKRLKAQEFISHIYVRKSSPLWPYGLYTMIHARSQKELSSRVQELSRLMRNCGFKALRTVKEFKKTSFNPNFATAKFARRVG